MAQQPHSGLVRFLAPEDGYSMIEIVIAIVVLVVGMLGVLTLVSGALRTTSANNGRVGATNLVRELIEGTRGLDYYDMTGALVQTRLQARGLGSGSPWNVSRRGVTYTITATSCSYDDPADKLAATPPAGVCSPQPAGTSGDANGDDFRRTTFAIRWRDASGADRSVVQTTLVVNPSGGLGPRIVSFTPVTQTITAAIDEAVVAWSTTTAQTLRWVVDDGASHGTETGSTSFTTTWDIGNIGGAGEILDGSYQVTGQPFDDLDIAGEAKRANVVLNRRRPYAPPAFAGGHNTRVASVDLQWSPNSERDILGYRVMWAGLDRTVDNGDDVQVCPTIIEGPMLAVTTTSCVHLSPPVGATTYYMVAIDRTRENQPRDGDQRTLAIAAAGPRPHQPTGLGDTTVNGRPKLSWNPPSSGGVSFYRIYRDGFRYDRTTTATTTFTDGSAGDVLHWYHVSTVDSAFNESDLTGPEFWWP